MSEFIYDKAGATEAQQKKALAYLFAQSTQGKASTGVISGLLVSQTGTASANVLIDAGGGVSQDTAGAGASVLINDTQKTLDILTANPMGATPRNDIVVFDSATTSIRVIVGTPNAVPTDPTVPTTAIPLARLRHAASATTVPTAKIDDLRVLTSQAGGRVVVTGTAQRDLLVKYVGLQVYRTDLLREETWNGTGWFTRVYGFGSTFSTNASGDFSLVISALATVLVWVPYNGNGQTASPGKANITFARNAGTYTGNTVTGRVWAGQTGAVVASAATVTVDWVAEGYAA